MKWLYVLLGILTGIALAFFALMYAASELGGEVVVLHRPAEDGSIDRVRVWIVEDTSGTWIEHGGADAPWVARLASDPTVTVERGGVPRQYHASPDPESCALYHRLRQDRYGIAARIVAMGTVDAAACTDVPVRLRAMAGLD